MTLRLFIALLAVSAMAGCELNFKPGTESLLEGLNTTISPGELATMALDPYDPNNRYVGTLGLANETFANEPVYIKLFEDNLKDPEPSVRFAAARGLGNHGDPSHVPLLVKSLSDPDRLVRMESARSLQRVHNPVAIEPLIAAMHEPDATRPKDPSEPEAIVRAEAAIALGQYQELKVLQALVAGLDDSELAVNQAALQSLQMHTGQDFQTDRAAWADWLGRTKEPFAAHGTYTYPVYYRDYRWYEYLPFVPKPHNEVATPPAGMPRG